MSDDETSAEGASAAVDGADADAQADDEVVALRSEVAALSERLESLDDALAQTTARAEATNDLPKDFSDNAEAAGERLAGLESDLTMMGNALEDLVGNEAGDALDPETRIALQIIWRRLDGIASQLEMSAEQFKSLGSEASSRR
jgi:chromosome segregation ATPase